MIINLSVYFFPILVRWWFYLFPFKIMMLVLHIFFLNLFYSGILTFLFIIGIFHLTLFPFKSNFHHFLFIIKGDSFSALFYCIPIITQEIELTKAIFLTIDWEKSIPVKIIISFYFALSIPPFLFYPVHFHTYLFVN